MGIFSNANFIAFYRKLLIFLTCDNLKLAHPFIFYFYKKKQDHLDLAFSTEQYALNMLKRPILELYKIFMLRTYCAV